MFQQWELFSKFSDVQTPSTLTIFEITEYLIRVFRICDINAYLVGLQHYTKGPQRLSYQLNS